MNQIEIENRITELQIRKSSLQKEISDVDKNIEYLRKIEAELYDPHALIPKQYSTIEEWLEGHPFPNAVNAMRFKNKREAYMVQLSCNTYQDSYHIVKI
ncbi:hypothetical protein [Sphingobacterium siyangense]|uniref:hypothetical protein n=1 Tax=Sphingobacterium siyangense TaxID=459529 RepID=UPI003DA6B9CA